MRLRGAPVLLAFLGVLAVGACVPRDAHDGRPLCVPLEPRRVAAAYAPVGPLPEARLRLQKTEEGYEIWRVDLPGRLPASLAAADRVPLADEGQAIRMTWYRPTGGDGAGTRRPAVLISPILGSSTDFVTDFAETFARRGWHGLLVRRLKVDYDATRPLEQVEERLGLAVSRQVQALDWLLTRDDVDAARIGSFGISAGGITSAMVAGVDPRYVAHVCALAGGPLADVFVESDEEGLQKLAKRGMAQYGISRDELRERLRAVIRTDPVLLAPHVDPRSVFLVVARFDEVVPAKYGRRLRDALGGPRTTMLPLGHYTSVVALPLVKSEAVGFLSRRFAKR